MSSDNENPEESLTNDEMTKFLSDTAREKLAREQKTMKRREFIGTTLAGAAAVAAGVGTWGLKVAHDNKVQAEKRDKLFHDVADYLTKNKDFFDSYQNPVRMPAPPRPVVIQQPEHKADALEAKKAPDVMLPPKNIKLTEKEKAKIDAGINVLAQANMQNLAFLKLLGGGDNLPPTWQIPDWLDEAKQILEDGPCQKADYDSVCALLLQAADKMNRPDFDAATQNNHRKRLEDFVGSLREMEAATGVQR